MNRTEELGEVLRSAYFDDREFRDAVAPINRHFEKISLGTVKGIDPDIDPNAFKRSISVSSGFNQYIVSAFHASTACERLHANSIKHLKETRANHPYFMTFQHAFGLEAVLNLALSKGLLTNRRFREVTDIDVAKVEEIYDEKFPLLNDARNSLAHQDERSLGLHSFSSDEHGSRRLAQLQWQRGACFGGLTRWVEVESAEDQGGRGRREVQEFEFYFEPERFFPLIDGIKRSLRI
jgi:hypothetical protein